MICELCGREGKTERHHVFFGRANRKLSEKYKMVACLCPDCHQYGAQAVHRCRSTDLFLRVEYQQRFEEEHTREEFRKIFGKSYL
jgi:ribosome-binding protein aMBF1 (putative translation factor)